MKRAQKHAAPKAKTRQPARTAQATTETVLSQRALLLAAIRTAPQPLTVEALRQMPGVKSGRIKRNVARLVAWGKIQATPVGYVVVSMEGSI
jgi:predicted HTH transcriptional regulator